MTGNLLTSSDTDWYKFTVADKGCMNFGFETEAESGEWILELFETPESNFSFYKTTFKAGSETNISADIGLDEGEYYAKIRNSVWHSDDYRLNFNFIPNEKWESEFNNDFDTADEIIPNSSISGCLMSSSDKDYYKFTLEDDGYVNLDFLTDAAGNSVAYHTMELMDSTEEHKVIYTVQIKGDSEITPSGNIGLAKGTYFVRVKPNSTLTKNYTINLGYVKASDWEKELNNTKETATLFPMNSTMNGNLKKSPDTDYYKFSLDKDDTIFIDFERPSDGKTTVYWVVGIIDESGTYKQRYYMKGDEELTSTEGLDLGSGNYYMHIQASTFNTSDYKITIKNSGYKETDTPDEITYGDANLDDKVSISDAVSILQYIANGEKYPLSDKALRNADVDGNAGVSGKDAAEIQKYDAGVISIFPVQEK
ncbi:MAG: dockerin type I repeat-containing protein [Ruminococcus sp.]|nr:dockerin type I repeat-containing protein [Ruminococcus sp.]